MEFLDIPVEVVDKLLPFLGWNDLLRFRRVCIKTKEVVNAYIRVNPDLVPEIEINEIDKSFGAFLEMNLPTTRIFLNNVSPEHELYEKNAEDVALFLDRFGPLVKHLRVHQLSYYVHGKEWDILDALVNLKSFEAGYFGYGGTNACSEEEISRALKKMSDRAKLDRRFVNSRPPFPQVFKQLQALKIGQQKDIFPIQGVASMVGSFLEDGKDLEYISFPFNSDDGSTDPRLVMQETFRIIGDALKEDKDGEGPQNPKIKALDFVNYHDEGNELYAVMNSLGTTSFLPLCKLSRENNIKLMNVNPFWFIGRDLANMGDMFPFLDPDLFRSLDNGVPIVSLASLHHAVYPLEMPNLERIEIRATSRCCVDGPGVNWRQARPDWQNLKYLDITVDNKQTLAYQPDANGQQVCCALYTKEIFQFFFEGISRPTLVELRLNFTKEPGDVAVPKAENIVNSCPNLKKLTIVNWPGTNKALSKLFEGLPELEEISLENCKGLGNVALVGLDTQNPVFFRLKKLRRLSLKGLDKMPKITDLLFSMVIRHLQLKHLTLTADSPLKTVSSTGILSLLEGKFAESIEKFRFQNWSLENVSAEDFKKMEAKFRSYDMI